MGEVTAQQVSEQVDALYRNEARRIFATLVRLLGDFDLAEEALQDAFVAAVKQWSQTGIPQSPRAWLVSAGRFKAIDTLRRRARLETSAELDEEIGGDEDFANAVIDPSI